MGTSGAGLQVEREEIRSGYAGGFEAVLSSVIC